MILVHWPPYFCIFNTQASSDRGTHFTQCMFNISSSTTMNRTKCYIDVILMFEESFCICKLCHSDGDSSAPPGVTVLQLTCLRMRADEKDSFPLGIYKSTHISSSATSLWADSISFLVNSRMISFNLPQIPPAVGDHLDSWETSFSFFFFLFLSHPQDLVECCLWWFYIISLRLPTIRFQCLE